MEVNITFSLLKPQSWRKAYGFKEEKVNSSFIIYS